MKLVVGLGNPGRKYEGTRHNVGFRVLDDLSGKLLATRRPKQAWQADLAECEIDNQKLLLVWPQTFMNLSGTSVKALVDKYSVEAREVLVLYDDLALPWTGLRVRPSGSAGGHHGVEDVIKRLGTQEFPRIRLGIDPGHPRNGIEFVLSPIKKAQIHELEELLDHAAAATESILAEGVEKAMTKFNRRAQGLTKEEE
jgi:PTH1 family peptidyl-tRNA hydrolase